MLELNKIHQGDCLELMQEIPDKSIDMILCDPPYGTTACKWDAVIPLEHMWEEYERVIKDHGNIVIFSDEPFTSNLIMSKTELFKYRITWDKMQGSNFLNSKKMPLKQTEDICVFAKNKLGKITYNPIMREKDADKVRTIGNRKPVGVTTYGANNGQLSVDYNKKMSHPTNLIVSSSKQKECNSLNRVHPTQKPVTLFEYLIKTYTNEGETVLDNCIGSGTTAIASLNTGRYFIGIEKEKEYVDIANKRIEEHQQLTIGEA